MAIHQVDNRTDRHQLEEGEKCVKEQREEGRKIVKSILKELAIKLERPEINDFSLKVYGIGISPDQEEILDKNGSAVTKISLECLEDAPASSDTRHKIEAHLEAAIRANRRI